MLLKLLEDLKPQLEVIATPRASTPTATTDHDVIVTATTANEPFLTAERTKHAKLLVNLGLREVAKDSISSFDEIVCDDLESCKKQYTPFGELIRDRAIEIEKIKEFSEIYFDPWKFEKERVYFQPSGMVAIDLLLASKISDLLQ